MTSDTPTLDVDLSGLSIADQLKITQVLARSQISNLAIRRLNNRSWRLSHGAPGPAARASGRLGGAALPAPVAFAKSAPEPAFSPRPKKIGPKKTAPNGGLAEQHTSPGSAAAAPTGSSSSDSSQKPENKNIFFIANSPSPTEKCEIPSPSELTSAATTAHAVPDNIQRQDSLFSNQYQNVNYSSSDLSDDGIDEEDEDEYTDEEVPKSSSSRHKTDDDSEWMSMSSDDEKPDTLLHPLNFSKRAPPSRQMSADTLTPAENSPLARPRSLLSGLFLSELPKQHEKASSAPFYKKPILKRSSTTGIITIGQDKDTNDRSRIQRPSILFSKKFTSMTDISKKYPHFKNPLVSKDILYDEIVEADNANDDDLGALNKQKSIVGISDFNASSETPQAVSTAQISPRNSSSLLSSSLNKFSSHRNHSSHSFKNLISRSSINLTGMFNRRSRNLEVPDAQMYSATPESHSIPLDAAHAGSVSSCKSSSIDIAKKPIERPSTSPEGDPRREHSASLDIDPKTSPFSPKTTRRAMLESELSKSLKDSIIIDYKLGKIPLPSKVIPHESLSINDTNDYNYDDYHAKGW